MAHMSKFSSSTTCWNWRILFHIDRTFTWEIVSAFALGIGGVNLIDGYCRFLRLTPVGVIALVFENFLDVTACILDKCLHPALDILYNCHFPGCFLIPKSMILDLTSLCIMKLA